MRVLLVDVGTDRNELNEPIGIEILAGVLRHHFSHSVCVRTEYLQLTNGKMENMKGKVSDCDVLGISTQINSLARIEALLECVRILQKKPIVLLGNLIATFAYDYLLKSYPNCICVLGEGEDALCSTTQALLRKRDVDVEELKEIVVSESIPNIALSIKGKIITTERRLVNLETATKPSRDFLETIIKKRGIVRIEGSRGCPWGHCTFCAISAKYGFRKWRPYPVNKIVEELTEISNAGGKNPYFTDEDFFGDNTQRAEEISDAILAAKEEGKICNDLNFYVNIPATAVVDHKPTLRKLKKAGLREIFIGLESGSNKQIRRYGKEANLDKNVDSVETARKLDLSIDIGYIMFDPEMTLEDLEENMNFLERLGLVDHDARDIKKVRVEPGTTLERRLFKQKVISLLDVNNLSYPYKFENHLIEKIVGAYEAWEEPVRDEVYTLQARARGEVESEDIRTKRRRLLGKFRRVDFEVLEALVEEFKRTNENNQPNIDIFYKKRENLIEQLHSVT